MAHKFYTQFAQELIKRADLALSDGSVDKTYAEKVGEQVEQRMGLWVLESLPKPALDAYADLLAEKTSGERIVEFLHEHIPDFENKRKETLQQFAADFLERAKTLNA